MSKTININIRSLIENFEHKGNDTEMLEAKHKIEDELLKILDSAVGSYKKRVHHTIHLKDMECVQEMMKELARLKYHETTTVGLYAFDRHPGEVSKKWIEKNCFRITSPDNAPGYDD